MNWTEPFDTGDPSSLGVTVSMRFGLSISTDGASTFREGDAVWRLTLVRAGAGWLASDVDLVESTESP